MAGLRQKLSRKQESAILALLTHRNVEEAARASGVGVRTLYRWMSEPAFDAAYRAARRAGYGQAVARLHQMSGAAASLLGKVISDPAAPTSSRVRAAEAILDRAHKAIELEDLDARLTELERAAQVAENGRKR